MKRLVIGALPAAPLAAAGVFHRDWLPGAEAILAGGEDLLIVLDPADYTHRDWRRSVAAGLARAHAPLRVNLVAAEGAALDAIATYLASAPAITGHYLDGDDLGAGDPVGAR